MTERQFEVLNALYSHRGYGRNSTGNASWARPMDVGGRDGSHHSATLRALVRGGWALARKSHSIPCWVGETKRRTWVSGEGWLETDGHPPAPCNCKGSIRYHISPRALLFVFERIE